MNEIVQMIGDYSLSIVLAGAFIYVSISNSKTLALLSESNQSIATSLKLLEQTMGTHDERARLIKETVDKVAERQDFQLMAIKEDTCEIKNKLNK